MRAHLLCAAVAVSLFAGGLVLAGPAFVGTAPAATSPTKAGTRSSGLTGPPIKIFSIVDETQPAPVGFTPSTVQTALAAVKTINSQGGVHRSPIELTLCDSKSNASDAAACAHLAATGGYVAVVGGQSSFDSAIAPILQQAQIPVVGWLPNSSPAWSAPNFYCLNGTFGAEVLGFGAIAKLMRAHRAALFESAPASSAIGDWFRQGVQAAGVALGNVVAAPTTSNAVAASVTQALSGGSDAIALVDVDVANIPAEIQAIRQQAPHEKIILAGLDLMPGTLAQLGAQADGIDVSALAASPWDTAVPGVRQFTRELHAHRANLASIRSDAMLLYWMDLHAFADIARTIKGSITAPSVAQAVRATSGLYLGGLVPPFDASQLGAGGQPACSASATIVPWTIKKGAPVSLLAPGTFVGVPGGKLLVTKVTHAAI